MAFLWPEFRSKVAPLGLGIRIETGLRKTERQAPAWAARVPTHKRKGPQMGQGFNSIIRGLQSEIGM
ncbi:hypothetical protein CaCOL14_012249 [Colletotrichum acutatum]